MEKLVELEIQTRKRGISNLTDKRTTRYRVSLERLRGLRSSSTFCNGTQYLTGYPPNVDILTLFKIIYSTNHLYMQKPRGSNP